MRDHLSIKSLWQCALVLCVLLAAAGCDGLSTPTQPTPQPPPTPVPGPVPAPPPGSPISVLAITAVTVGGSPNDVAPTIRLAETGGSSEARVTSITFNLADGVPWPTSVECGYCKGITVWPRTEVMIEPPVNTYGDYVWSFSVPWDYTGRLAVTVTYEDEERRRGTVSALVDLPWVR